VVLKGISPLLMNSPKSMLNPDEGSKNRLKKYDHKIEAEKVAYRTDKGELYMPSEAVKGCLINASSWKKVGKNSLKPIMAAAVRIAPRQIVITDEKKKIQKEYEIDLRTVVIQRARVVKARPKINKWLAAFTVIYNETMITPDVIEQCLKEAGERVGLLDFRPQNTGEFGMFEVESFKPVK